jgi:hypothetical protein
MNETHERLQKAQRTLARLDQSALGPASYAMSVDIDPPHGVR